MAVHIPLKAVILAASATFMLAACNNSDNEYEPAAAASAEPAIEISSDDSDASSMPGGTDPHAVVEGRQRF